MNIVLPKFLSQLRPYSAGKPIKEVQTEYGISMPVKLASNENPLGPSPKAIAAIKEALQDIHRYPDSQITELRYKLASVLGVKSQQIVIGNGSDEIMSFIGQAFLLSGEEVIVPFPSFSIYEKVAIMSQANLIKVPLKNLSIDLEAIKDRISQKTKLIFLTNPHNPTGSFFEAPLLENFLKNVPRSTLIILDEAYIDFVSPKRHFESLNYLKDFSNLIILRSFSKSYGLAGLRVGYGIMNIELANILERVRYPFNVNTLAQVAAINALDDKEFLETTRKLVWEGREFITKALTELGIRVYPSEANFLLVYIGKKAVEIYESLLKKGIIVRPLTNYHLPEYIRISIGKPEENQTFIEFFKEIWQK
ncbi:histidinol-phosphate aminotransferase [Candidatus Desulfofervidus auxilii]|uniref:Histidinol-phosphate aminotransferase n=1 Tax=Desulfofervidus auxilii TaxID=1621989 RepID=A0A7U4QLM9_DESA2|nr:histidinol-phosphate transaminase [Candidatus Desulfofervidus auxilii]AMM41630.1 histidinol-phosphate aminotransferase [Candidatus Desulfofervidus auxilii]